MNGFYVSGAVVRLMLLAFLSLVGYMAWIQRGEIQRYIKIERM